MRNSEFLVSDQVLVNSVLLQLYKDITNGSVVAMETADQTSFLLS